MDEKEINIFDLIKNIMCWKFFILGIILCGLLLATLLFYNKPVVYISSSSVKIGKIAGVPVEKFEDLKLYLRSLNMMESNTVELDKKASSAELDTQVINISSTGDSYAESRSMLVDLQDKIVNHHEQIYKESLNNFAKLDKTKLDYYYLISSYTYPTEILGNIVTNMTKGGLSIQAQNESVKFPVFHKGLIKYLIVLVFGLLFLGIISALMVDYVLSEIKKRKTV